MKEISWDSVVKHIIRKKNPQLAYVFDTLYTHIL